MEQEHLTGFFLGVAVTYILVCFIFVFFVIDDIGINQETGNDICVNLTGDINAIAIDSKCDGIQGNSGKLICEVPSFDSTTNIIVKGAGE